jgi:hypothetical protein
MTLLRHGRACHGRACPGHPRLASWVASKAQDARDIGVRKHAVLWTAMRGRDAVQWGDQ